jgi:RsmE family RNA methyltransferase
MNLILLDTADYIDRNRVRLSGRRFEHMLKVQRADTGQEFRVGQIDGKLGTGTVSRIDVDSLELQLELTEQPPAPLPVTLLLALPRPKMLKRILQCVTSLGVKQIYLINSYRVEKSFWGSPLLQPEKLREQLLLGLEQAADTILPEVHLRQRFKPFVEDELPRLSEATENLVAHPVGEACDRLHAGVPTTLAIGPEGGFIPYEIDKLAECGFCPLSLGTRILRVETAVPVLLSRLLPR